MSAKIVYVNPEEMLEIRVIDDVELPRNAAEWRYQLRPRSVLLTVANGGTIKFSDPALRVELTDVTGKTTKICN